MALQQVQPYGRPSLARLVAAAILAVVALLAVAPAALAAPALQNYRTYAGIVIDAKSGKTLYEEAADATRYPASISKVMTLYVLFQELAAGNIRLDDKMTVSAHAAAAVPTKLGLKAGSTIRVEDAIKAIVTLSANDMARVIAEHISGSEEKFAQRMTATARALGMSHTQYRNASGLPDAGQLTTVRDQARLAMAIYEHFPKYYAYFQTKSFSYGKRTYGNHNRLLGASGIDGIKTGYINASGYNLMTASRKDGRHLIVVGFGFNSAGARDKKVFELVQKFLPKARQGDYIATALVPQPGRVGNAPVMVAATEAPTFVEPMPFPAFRLATQQPATAAAPAAAKPQITPLSDMPVAVASAGSALPPADFALQPAVQAANQLGAPSAPAPLDRPDVVGAFSSDNYMLGAPPTELGLTRPSAPLLPPVGVGEDGAAIDPLTSNSTGKSAVQVASIDPAQTATAALPDGSWIVQIGAAPTEKGANALLSSAAQKIGALVNFRPLVERAEKNGQVFFRARFVGFGNRDAAAKMCTALKQAEMSCLALQS